MHSLTELKHYFETNKIIINNFNGMFLYTSHGKWGMASDEFRLNGKQISRKEIKQLIEQNV